MISKSLKLPFKTHFRDKNLALEKNLKIGQMVAPSPSTMVLIERSATYMTHVVVFRTKAAHAVGAVRQVVLKRVVLFRPGNRRKVNGVKGRCVDMLLSAADAVMS